MTAASQAQLLVRAARSQCYVILSAEEMLFYGEDLLYRACLDGNLKKKDSEELAFSATL